LIDYKALEMGTKVNYVIFTNLTYMGYDEQYVYLQNERGYTEKFYKDLFKKYGELQEKESLK